MVLDSLDVRDLVRKSLLRVSAAIVASAVAVACGEGPNSSGTNKGNSGAGGPGAVVGDAGSDPDAAPPPKGVAQVDIRISPEAMARLDADPFHAPDETGDVVIDGQAYSGVDVNYRGAWTLLEVDSLGLRNWKVKFHKTQPYRNRREWNFNYEPDFKQRLALELMGANGVKVSSAEHVIVSLNGAYQGVYLQYEDPDNYDWLLEQFGDGTGDLYKAANYTPGDTTKIYATMERVDPQDPKLSQYYEKKTNHDTVPLDYTSLFAFLDGLNGVTDSEFPQWLETNFDVAGFIRYLVVANFISHWDSLPVRPKNFWLYQNRFAQNMVYIPWDMNEVLLDQDPAVDDGYNQMGIHCPIFFNMPSGDYHPMSNQESTARPLTDRMMGFSQYRDAYVANYREALATVFVPTELQRHVDELLAYIRDSASSSDLQQLEASADATRRYLADRYQAVVEELGGY